MHAGVQHQVTIAEGAGFLAYSLKQLLAQASAVKGGVHYQVVDVDEAAVEGVFCQSVAGQADHLTVFASGEQVVADGRHHAREAVEARYRRALSVVL